MYPVFDLTSPDSQMSEVKSNSVTLLMYKNMEEEVLQHKESLHTIPVTGTGTKLYGLDQRDYRIHRGPPGPEGPQGRRVSNLFF